MNRRHRDSTPGPDDNGPLPWWVQWWVPPTGGPLLALAVLISSLTVGWLPVVFGWRYFQSYDPWAGAVCASLVGIWITVAVIWMYRHGRWPRR